MTSPDELNANLHKRNGIKVSSALRQRRKQAVFTLKLLRTPIMFYLVPHLLSRVSRSVEVTWHEFKATILFVTTNYDAVLQVQNMIKSFLVELLTLQMPATTVG
jgi:hypothetical protein